MLKTVFILLFITATVLGCASKGACGCCGCRTKAKARGVALGKIDGDQLVEHDDKEDDGDIFGLKIWNASETIIDSTNFQKLTNPNFLFHTCCEARNLPPACVQKCHFNVYDRETLEAIFLGHEECPLEYIDEMQFCAAQGMDHSQCCKDHGVDSTEAGEKCLIFCDQRPDLFTPLDYSYAPCMQRFDSMKRCFYDEVHARAEAHFAHKLKSQMKKQTKKPFWLSSNKANKSSFYKD